jgi:hypothetical protein
MWGTNAIVFVPVTGDGIKDHRIWLTNWRNYGFREQWQPVSIWSVRL